MNSNETVIAECWEGFSYRFNILLDMIDLPALNKGRVNEVARIFKTTIPGARLWVSEDTAPRKKKLFEIAIKVKDMIGTKLSTEEIMGWLHFGGNKPFPSEPIIGDVGHKMLSQVYIIVHDEMRSLNLSLDDIPEQKIEVFFDTVIKHAIKQDGHTINGDMVKSLLKIIEA